MRGGPEGCLPKLIEEGRSIRLAHSPAGIVLHELADPVHDLAMPLVRLLVAPLLQPTLVVVLAPREVVGPGRFRGALL